MLVETKLGRVCGVVAAKAIHSTFTSFSTISEDFRDVTPTLYRTGLENTLQLHTAQSDGQ